VNSSTRARVGLSAGLIVFIPAVAGLTINGPDTPKPDPAKAELTINVDSASFFGDAAAHERYIIVKAPGIPPSGPTRLVSTSGANVAEVSGQQKCPANSPTFDTGLANPKPWCLKIAGPHAGSEVKGILEGTAHVTLTLRNRHRFLFVPLLVTIAGFLAGAFALLWPPFLTAINRKSELDRLLRANERAPAQAQIADLRDWVGRKRLANATDADLLPLVSTLVREGPSRAQRFRQDLRDQIASVALPATQPVVAAAEIESASTTNKVSDFWSDDDKPTVHPAEKYNNALTQLLLIEGRIESSASRIAALDDTNKAAMTPSLQAASAFFRRADLSELDELEKQVGALQQKIDEVAGQLAVAAAGAPAAASVSLLDVPRVSPGVARLLTYVTTAIIAALGILALFASVYAATPTFGSAGDYYKLFAAAVASSAVASAVSVLNWRSAS
jgi:plasmid stabilization system protein ParE